MKQHLNSEISNLFNIFFRYDARDPNVNATSWSDSPPRGFGDRAQFDPSDVQLSVNGIQAQEGGLYRCRVDFQRSQTSNVLVNLTVIGKGISWFKVA